LHANWHARSNCLRWDCANFNWGQMSPRVKKLECHKRHFPILWRNISSLPHKYLLPCECVEHP
jgi:hypothetical protein